MKDTKIALLTRSRYRSPLFLAYSLKRMLLKLGVVVDVFEDGLSWLEIQGKKSLSLRDSIVSKFVLRKISKLKEYDLIIISDTLIAFKASYDISLIKSFSKPILHYEVFFVGGSQEWLKDLPSGCLNKFDTYLSVSHIHDSVPLNPQKNYCIGLDLSPLCAFQNERPFMALLDFEREGYEKERRLFKKVLMKLSIPFVELKGEYTFGQIENIYKDISVAFVSFPEAFGVPIVQLQYYGAYIVSPHRRWVKRHALLPMDCVYFDTENPRFSENFIFFKNEAELIEQLLFIKKNYDANLVRSRFLSTSPQYAVGNIEKLCSAIGQYL